MAIPTLDEAQEAWYQVAKSTKLAKKDVKTIKIGSQEIVLFRAEDGNLAATDAHCPHLGAHLGKGGKVVDGKIQCPFHHWQFDQNGQCARIPYSEKIPRGAKIRSYLVIEAQGTIFLFYGSVAKADTHALLEYLASQTQSKYGITQVLAKMASALRRWFGRRAASSDFILTRIAHNAPAHDFN